ncbi:MAG: hypothetical protein ASARMPREDX12_003112 [Alectoria sarmentosa]|nr:MAG: hypothetical protein ASARMPREDX12_003112 [Alectoria sarmentosa]
MVGRAKQKNRAPLQTASNGPGLKIPQPPTQMAPADRSLLNVQPVLQESPNGRSLPNTQLPSQTPDGYGPSRSRPAVLIDCGLENPQPPIRPAPTGPSVSRSQLVSSPAPNRHVPPKIPPQPKLALKKKEDIPYEIKNAREWDPKRRLGGDSSSESSDDNDYYASDYDEHPQVFGESSSIMADDGFQTVVNKRSQPTARLRSQPPDHLKAYPHGKPPGQRRAHPRANFTYKRDNLARAAFRKRLEPTGRFMLPKDCPDIEPNQKKMYDTFDQIGVRLGSFVRPPQHVKDRELLLWGDARQVQATIAELNRWLVNRPQIDLPRTSMAKDKFAKELSTIGDQYYRLRKKMQKEAKILEFQQVPAEGRVFSHTGTFIWPIEEVRPDDILGSSLEAFDPIRFQNHCHIVFDNKLSSFRIFSDKEEEVKKTMDRMVGTMKEYIAKSVRPDTIILVEPPSSSAIRMDVKVLPASLNGPKAGKSMVPMLIGRTMDPEAREEWLNESNELTMKNNHRMELSLRKCIANLPHYRGLVRMRVQFGTFALKVFRWKEGADSTPIEEFMENMTMSGTKGVMIRDLQIKKDATTILAKVQNATDLFLPVDSSIISLNEVVPSFSACFEFGNSDSPPMNLTLELSSSPAAPTIYEKVQELWTRMDRRDNAVPLEAFTARLDGGASWKLQVSTENSIDSSRLNLKMTGFAESVKLSKIPRTRIELTGQRVFTWEKDLPGVLQPSAFQQKTALRYRLAQQPEWEFEIARYDNYGDPKNENVPVETNWGATLYDSNWDSTLTANSTLGIGEAARWEPRLETFFPSRPGAADMEGVDPGVTEFLKNVEVVTRFIDSIKRELPHLRG